VDFIARRYLKKSAGNSIYMSGCVGVCSRGAAWLRTFFHPSIHIEEEDSPDLVYVCHTLLEIAEDGTSKHRLVGFGFGIMVYGSCLETAGVSDRAQLKASLAVLCVGSIRGSKQHPINIGMFPVDDRGCLSRSE